MAINNQDKEYINEAVEQFLMKQISKGACYEECLKAHYRQGKIINEEWVNDSDSEDSDSDDEEEWFEGCEKIVWTNDKKTQKERELWEILQLERSDLTDEEIDRINKYQNKVFWGDSDSDDEFEGIDFTKTNKIIAELKGCELALKEID